MKRLLPFIALAILLFGAIFLWGRGSTPHPAGLAPSTRLDAGATRTIDLDKTLAIALPHLSATMTPAAFQTPDGKQGWVLRLPGISGFMGGLPLPTPAYDNGKLFLGGGFGSSDFYAINASTGDMIWHEPTSDNGPTSASVDHGNVAFNTQSCSLMVMDENNGQTLWKEWLGDPLVTQPAVSKGRVYASFPNTNYGDDVGASAAITLPPSTLAFADGGSGATPSAHSSSDGYSLLCADVKHGGHIWQRNIPAEIISAPAIVGDRVYVACYDGTLESLSVANGNRIWIRHLRATSAPVVGDGKLVVTVRDDRHGKPYEGIVRLDASTGLTLDRTPLVLSPAPYLDSGGCTGIDPATRSALDSLEGFPSGTPITFEIGDSSPPLVDLSSVTGAWAYQGSRVALAGNRAIDAQGSYVNAVSAANGVVLWRVQAVGKDLDTSSQVFSPPALGKTDLYLVSAAGDLVALTQSTGDTAFAYKLGHPIAAQPILAGGNIYISTSDGLLICIKTAGKDAFGWPAWGGNAQHDKAN